MYTFGNNFPLSGKAETALAARHASPNHGTQL